MGVFPKPQETPKKKRAALSKDNFCKGFASEAIAHLATWLIEGGVDKIKEEVAFKLCVSNL